MNLTLQMFTWLGQSCFICSWWVLFISSFMIIHRVEIWKVLLYKRHWYQPRLYVCVCVCVCVWCVYMCVCVCVCVCVCEACKSVILCPCMYVFVCVSQRKNDPRLARKVDLPVGRRFLVCVCVCGYFIYLFDLTEWRTEEEKWPCWVALSTAVGFFT